MSYLKPKKSQLHASDVMLVMNTVASSASFREDESWLPICLPRFNAAGFLYAHISFVAPELCLVLLTPKPDGFPQLSAARATVVEKLDANAELRGAMIRAVASPQYAVDELDVPEVRHCLYRLSGGAGGLDLLSAPRTGALAGPQCPYHDRPAAKRLLRAYQLAHARVHATPGKPLREFVMTTEAETIVVWCTADAELYATFGPLMPKPYAIAACHKLLRRLKKEQASLFVAHAVTK